MIVEVCERGLTFHGSGLFDKDGTVLLDDAEIERELAKLGIVVSDWSGTEDTIECDFESELSEDLLESVHKLIAKWNDEDD